MKKQMAFSLAETLLTLVIVSVLAVIMMSTIKGNMPKKQQIIFIKAFRNLETATADIIKDESRYDQGAHATTSIGFNQAPLSTSRLTITHQNLTAANAYCYFIAEQMNVTRGDINCSASGKNFQSTNGACYYDLYPFGSEFRDVTIDTACKGRSKDMFTVRVMANGKVTIPSTGKLAANQKRAAYWILNQGKFKEGSVNIPESSNGNNTYTSSSSGGSTSSSSGGSTSSSSSGSSSSSSGGSTSSSSGGSTSSSSGGSTSSSSGGSTSSSSGWHGSSSSSSGSGDHTLPQPDPTFPSSSSSSGSSSGGSTSSSSGWYGSSSGSSGSSSSSSSGGGKDKKRPDIDQLMEEH